MCLTISYSTIPKLSFVFSYRHTHQRLAIVSFSHSLNITSLFSKNTCYHYNAFRKCQPSNKMFLSHSTELAFTFALTWLLACWRPVSFHLPWSYGSWDSGRCLLSRASQTGWCPGPPSGCIWCAQIVQSSWPEKTNDSTQLKSYYFMQFYFFHGKGLPSCYMYIKF